MNPVARALWYIESHSGQDIALADIAAVAGVSRYHLVRAFGMATGLSVMRYVRARRLSVAARALAAGAGDILAVALDAGYGSHEAFTRAFREQFGATPESVRASGDVSQLTLQEAFRMDGTGRTALGAPRFENGRAMRMAGFRGRFTFEDTAGIPALWQRFAPHLGLVPSEVAGIAYGVSYNQDETGGFDYMAGVEVGDFGLLPPEFARLTVAAQRYAVFAHTGHVSLTPQSYIAIFADWMPSSGCRLAAAPVLERHDKRFDRRTGLGGFEIWVPVERG
jgi:AraC family transcriptional regulator